MLWDKWYKAFMLPGNHLAMNYSDICIVQQTSAL